MKRYYDYSTEEKLALSNEELKKSIEIEAAERGVKIPIPLPEAVTSMPYAGFTVPAQSAAFWEITKPNSYRSNEGTGIAFTTEDAALAAVQGAICLDEDGYGDKKKVNVISGDFGIQKRWLVTTNASSFVSSLEQYSEDRKEFDELAEECMTDLRGLRQRQYDKQVIEAKMVKYLDLANGDEETAKRFWQNIERTEWPSEIQ